MKKSMLLTVAIGLGAAALLASTASAGTTPGSGIVKSKHDLSVTGGYPVLQDGDDALERVCIFCHAPHHAIKPDANNGYSPLWNRPFSGTTSFTMYSNGTNPGNGAHASQAMLEGATAPGDVSMLCLSCHDGSVALNVYGSNNMSDSDFVLGTPYGSIQGGGYDGTITGSLYIPTDEYRIGDGGDLSNHHPIGFSYQAVQQADNEIADSGVAFPGSGVVIDDVLYGQNMECITCHDVHNSTDGMGEKFLWASNAQSNFCCTCHLKCN